jgi:hypothetical protein
MSYISNDPSKPKLLFIHIPKTGGTSVEEWFEKTYGVQNITVHKHAPINYRNLSSIDAYKFSTVRNPFSRAVSWYQQALSLILLGESTTRFQIHGLVKEEWDKGFDYFIQHYFHVSRMNPGDDIPICPATNQVDYICLDGKLAVDKLLRFENLDMEFKEIEKITGTKHGLGRLKVGPSDDLRDWRKVYTPASKKLIEDIYKKDLDFFSYEF